MRLFGKFSNTVPYLKSVLIQDAGSSASVMIKFEEEASTNGRRNGRGRRKGDNKKAFNRIL